MSNGAKQLMKLRADSLIKMTCNAHSQLAALKVAYLGPQARPLTCSTLSQESFNVVLRIQCLRLVKCVGAHVKPGNNLRGQPSI